MIYELPDSQASEDNVKSMYLQINKVITLPGEGDERRARFGPRQLAFSPQTVVFSLSNCSPFFPRVRPLITGQSDAAKAARDAAISRDGDATRGDPPTAITFPAAGQIQVLAQAPTSISQSAIQTFPLF